MRKVFFKLIFLVTLTLISCRKNEHQIRFTNNYIETIRNIKVGDVSLSDVSPGESSEYKVIPESEFKISGQAANGYLEGSGSVSGKGEHKWTVQLNPDKSLTMIHDKIK